MKNLNKYLDHIRASYVAFGAASKVKTSDAYRKQANKEFSESLAVVPGNKYMKVIKKLGSQTLVHSFIVMKDTKKFKAGDILMAASWKAPATNFARGNVINGDFANVRWTGA